MPILLTTPFNPGAFDPGQAYPRAKIVLFFDNIANKSIKVCVDFGDIVDGNWGSGAATGKEKTFFISGEAYDTMMSAFPDEGETVYAAVKRLLYEYLTTNVPELAGTIE